MRLRVRDLAGENCVTAEAGATLHGAIAAAISAEVTELDFDGCRVFASPFFNASLGRLVGEVPAEALRERLKIENLPPRGEELLRRVIENARDYYARNPEARRAYDAVVNSAPPER